MVYVSLLALHLLKTFYSLTFISTPKLSTQNRDFKEHSAGNWLNLLAVNMMIYRQYGNEGDNKNSFRSRSVFG